jgi:hypothetical protein
MDHILTEYGYSVVLNANEAKLRKQLPFGILLNDHLTDNGGLFYPIHIADKH